MTKKSTYRTKGLIDKLASYEPKDSLWGNIEAELDFESRLRGAIDGLPCYLPEKDIWNNIDQRLPQTLPASKTRRLHYWLSAAASFALIIGLTIFYLSKQNTEQLLVETEIIEEEYPLYKGVNTAGANDAIQLIKQLCKGAQANCHDKSFTEKMDLYRELETEAQSLEQAMQNMGESPEMVKALIRIENMKASTIRELISIINS